MAAISSNQLVSHVGKFFATKFSCKANLISFNAACDQNHEGSDLVFCSTATGSNAHARIPEGHGSADNFISTANVHCSRPVFSVKRPVNYGLHTGKEKPSNSYIPVCYDSSTVCITYPPGRFKGTTFGNASFEVTLLDAKTESACLTPRALPISSAPGAPTIPDFQIDPKHPSRVIDGTKFLHAVDFEGAMSHDIETNQYRGFKNGNCYNLAIHVTFTNFAVYDPGTIKEFTKHDIELVEEDLMRVLDSFKTIESR